MTYDVRAIANFVLDVADERSRSITNMHINKIVFFLHAEFLVTFQRPLVTAKIEAWQHGPVFRELYREFRSYEDKPIKHRAKHLNPASGEIEESAYSLIKEEEMFLRELVERYIDMTASALRAQSHVEGGPWDKTWNHSGPTNASMRISDEDIQSWYRKTVKH